MPLTAAHLDPAARSAVRSFVRRATAGLVACSAWLAVARAEGLAERPASITAIVSVLGAQIHVVREREPGTTELGFEYSREALREPGGSIDRAVVRAADRALARAGQPPATDFLALDIAPAALWRYREGADSPLSAALEQLSRWPGREHWGEVLLVTPARPGTMPPDWPRVRGVGLLLERVRHAPVDRVMTAQDSPRPAWPWDGDARPFAFIAVWRIDGRTLRVLARASSFEEDTAMPARRLSGSLLPAPLMDELLALVERTVETTADDVLTARTEPEPALTPRLPRAEVKADRALCRSLEFQWHDAVAREREIARVAGANVELGKVAAVRDRIYRRSVSLGCPNAARHCGAEEALSRGLVEDIDDHDEIAARGVGDGYYVDYFAGPDTLACRELRRRRAQERAGDKPR